MTVHHRGTLAPTASDMQTTHQGVKLMLKLIAWDGGVPVAALAELRPTGWEVFAILYEFDDINLPEDVTRKAGGTVAWIKTVLLPAINAALAKRFPKTSTAPVVAGSLDDIDAQLLKALAWSPQADGTLRMVAK